MKIRSVRNNNRKKALEIATPSRELQFPHAKLQPRPSAADPIRDVFVDKELGNEAVTYVLESGKSGTVHIEQVLEYNEDPRYLRDSLLYKLTLEAQQRLEKSALSKREIIRRLGTSATQFYRLLDQTNYRKSVDQVLLLLQVLDCDVELVGESRPGVGLRVTQERKHFEHTFVLVANDPVAWLEQARGMQIAAQPILQTFLSLLHEAPSRPGARLQRLAYINAYMLLTGFAFENLLKAIAAKRGRLTVDLKARKLKFDKGLSQKGGHSLTGLGRSLNIELSPDEQQYLRRLEEYVWWAGRYPVPLEQAVYADSHGTRRLSFKTTDRGLGEQLFDKLAEIITREYQHVQ